MKKLGILIKDTSEKRIKDNLKRSDSVFVINYCRLSSPDLSSLRQSLRDTGASLFVIKNNVAKRALKNSGLESLVKTIEGPCGLIFIKDDPVNISRIVYNFSKGHEALRFQGGFLKDRVLEGEAIKALAHLPSREVLRAQVVMLLNSPISGLVMGLAQLLRKLVCCLEQIKNKKGENNG